MSQAKLSPRSIRKLARAMWRASRGAHVSDDTLIRRAYYGGRKGRRAIRRLEARGVWLARGVRVRRGVVVDGHHRLGAA